MKSYQEEVNKKLKEFEEMTKGKKVNKIHIQGIEDALIINVEGNLEGVSKTIAYAMVQSDELKNAILLAVEAFTFAEAMQRK